MDAFLNNVVCPKIKVTICASLPMVRENLKLIVESNRQLTVLERLAVNQEFAARICRQTPDVVLLYLGEDEGERIEILRETRKVAPQVKVVVLSSPTTVLDQTVALKLGVSGIVGANQSPRTLIRAIEQVADGEVWLNQKIISQLLDDGLSNKRTSKSASRNGFFRDELTSRELEVVRLIGGGMCNKEISKKLFISEATVRHHLSSIYSKLGVEDRLNLAIYAYRRRIVQPPNKGAIVDVSLPGISGYAAAEFAASGT